MFKRTWKREKIERKGKKIEGKIIVLWVKHMWKGQQKNKGKMERKELSLIDGGKLSVMKAGCGIGFRSISAY
jgi:hypothetical protein